MYGHDTLKLVEAFGFFKIKNFRFQVRKERLYACVIMAVTPAGMTADDAVVLSPSSKCSLKASAFSSIEYTLFLLHYYEFQPKKPPQVNNVSSF
jgi:hypothetical protein